MAADMMIKEWELLSVNGCMVSSCLEKKVAVLFWSIYHQYALALEGYKLCLDGAEIIINLCKVNT